MTDINMPVMNGIELLRQVKNRYPKLKVFMIRAYGDEHNFNAAKDPGADDCFTRPLQMDLLKEKISRLE